MVKIAVIGAGVNGLACAVRIKEKYNNFQVKIIATEFSPNTTGDGSGGLWYPYLCGDTPVQRIEKWGLETYQYLHELWKSGAINICVMPVFYMFTRKENFGNPSWVNAVYGYLELNRLQLECYNRRLSSNYVAGRTFTTFVIPPPPLLAYLQKRFELAGGELLQAKVTSLQDPMLKDFDIVINCTGLGARLLVPDDKMTPIRGQIARVKAPWLTETVLDDTGHYIIPNVEHCVLGGTSQKSYDTKLNSKDSDNVINGCKKMIPGLEHAEVISQWVGLRPGRESVRLEPEEIGGKLYIHNYGHGGSGLTLFWGCSSEVLQILDTYLDQQRITNRTCKL